MPRYYTIASSSMVHPKEVRIAVSLSQFDTPCEKGRLGLVSAHCQRLLSNAKDGKARIFVKDSNFNMNNSVPLLMVGPGTGVVPFIAFIEERELLQKQSQKIAEAHLFFGCRDKDSDFIYRDWLAEKRDKKCFEALNLAFSRSADGSPKQYVQDVLKNDTDLIERLLKTENGCLYVCGATKMGADVQALVRSVVGEDYYKEMEKNKRIIVELWSS